jgi:hypothetical protein
MSIRFAAAVHTDRNRMTRYRARAFCRLAANDNLLHEADHQLMHAALVHFARHGMAAARVAAEQARASLHENDEKAYAWWLGICRTLDRRLAREIAR